MIMDIFWFWYKFNSLSWVHCAHMNKSTKYILMFIYTIFIWDESNTTIMWAKFTFIRCFIKQKKTKENKNNSIFEFIYLICANYVSHRHVLYVLCSRKREEKHYSLRVRTFCGSLAYCWNEFQNSFVAYDNHRLFFFFFLLFIKIVSASKK